MGYRIHLNFCKKKDWESYLAESKEIDYLYKLPFENVTRVEIPDDLPLDSFEEMYIVNDEYLPYQLNKGDLETILDFYIDRQLEMIKESKEIYNKIVYSFHVENNFNTCEPQIHKLLFSTLTSNINKEFFWENLKSTKNYITNSDTYSFQYFYLVKLYESFNEKEDVIILTHG